MPQLPLAIHQFANDCTPGDGISNGMFYTRRLLRQAGVLSDIFCGEVHPQLVGDVLPLTAYQPGRAAALLIHHGIGCPHEAWLCSLPERKFMVFHNITPAELFPAEHPIQPALALGWEQVRRWASWLDGSIADSAQNLRELLRCGHAPERLVDIPLLVDLQRIRPLPARAVIKDKPFTLLFVGRVMPHKNQLGLLETFVELRRRVAQPLRLEMVGGFTVPAYAEQVRKRIVDLGLEGSVGLPGKVDDAALAGYYSRADLFIGLSHHEGFGMPFIEAMAYGVPVVAYDAPRSNIAATLGGAGLLLGSDGPQTVASALQQLMADKPFMHACSARGHVRLRELDEALLYTRLRNYLARFGLALPAPTSANAARDVALAL